MRYLRRGLTGGRGSYLPPRLPQRGGSVAMRRIKVILAVVAAVATLIVMAAPAMAQTWWGGYSLGEQGRRRRLPLGLYPGVG